MIHTNSLIMMPTMDLLSALLGDYLTNDKGWLYIAPCQRYFDLSPSGNLIEVRYIDILILIFSIDFEPIVIKLVFCLCFFLIDIGVNKAFRYRY